MDFNRRKDIVFLVLAGFFVTNAVVAELIGGKIVQYFGTFTQSIGIILWPVVFVLTDLINEHYGQKGTRRLTYITVGLIIYTYIIITVGLNTESVPFSPVDDKNFSVVFGQSQWIIIGSVAAFLTSQLIDVFVFGVLKRRTGGRMIWLRATGSTAISQLIDTFIVQFIAFVIPGVWTMEMFLVNASWGYAFKLIVALCLTPVIYLGHYVIRLFLKKDEVSAEAGLTLTGDKS
jgi:queuosine precursor transporter